MVMRAFIKIVVSLTLLINLSLAVAAQTLVDRGDSWQEVLRNKKGTVTALWNDIEPFIYINKDGKLQGVEYEIMESVKTYLKIKYGIELTIIWQRTSTFDMIYHQVKNSQKQGVFGWSYYSITPERKKQVQFSLPYMPDVNVLVTNNREPMYASSQEFIARLKEMNGYTQPNTTMEEDIVALQTNFFPRLPVEKLPQDYDILRKIAADDKGFGYVPLSIYIVALQKGIKVKRQNIFSSQREGFAAVMPLKTDWKPVMDEYFSTELFREKANAIVAKYLGSEVKDLVFGPHRAASVTAKEPALDLVSLEKEIVTKRLMDTALEVQRQRSWRNFMLIILLFLAILAGVIYSRFRTKQKLNKQLNEHNLQISRQHDQIEHMNKLLNLKILQARMNPHFLFNSLNSIQYFITGNDKKASLVYISRFSAFLRSVINYGDALSISVKEEAALLKEYLWLEHCRFPGKFEYDIKIAPDIGQSVILPMLTLGLAEDALYKGVFNLENGQQGKVTIEFTGNENGIVVQISDNGMPRSYSTALEKKKGLTNGEENMLTRRIEVFNQQSERRIVQKMTENENNNIAILEIPQPLFNQIHF